MTGRIRFGFNCDHVATLRQARREKFPDPVAAAAIALAHGADQVTAHLREDRRHIQENDLLRMKEAGMPINLEMARAPDVVAFALRLRPQSACLVPERREEVTTEGGLAVAAERDAIRDLVARLSDAGIRVSLFVDADEREIAAAAETGAAAVELHTGPYARGAPGAKEALLRAAGAARAAGLSVHAGHGLDKDNLAGVLDLPGLEEVNIGFAVVARAVFVGLPEAVREIRAILDGAR